MPVKEQIRSVLGNRASGDHPGGEGSERCEPDRLGHAFGFARALEALHVGQMPLILTVVAFAAGDDGRSHNDAGVQVFFPSPPTPGAGRGVRGEGFDSILLFLRLRPGGIDIEPLADDPRPPTAILDRLDPPQDQLRIGLTDGQGAHVRYYRPTIGRGSPERHRSTEQVHWYKSPVNGQARRSVGDARETL